MANATYGVTVSAGGIVLQSSVTRTKDGTIGVEATIPVAAAVGSWVKTDADTAAGTLTAGHGLTSGTFDVFWTGGRKYGVTGTISSNDISLDLGTGDDYPASADSTVVVSKQTQVNISIDGDALGLLALKLEVADASATSDGHATFKDSAGDTIAVLDLNANEVRVWDITGGDTNDFTGDPITVAYVSNSNTTYAATLKIGGVVDATP